MAWSTGGGIEGTVVVVTGSRRGVSAGRSPRRSAPPARTWWPSTSMPPGSRDARRLAGRRRHARRTVRGPRRPDVPPVDLRRGAGALRSLRSPRPRRRGPAPACRHRRDHRGRLGLPGRHQPESDVLPHAVGGDRIASTIAAREHHRVHVTGLDDRWLRWLGRLRRDEGRDRLDVEGDGEDVRQGRDPGEHGVARGRRHADDAQRADATRVWRRSSTTSRWAGWPNPTRSPAPSSSSRPTTPATSPAPRST